MAFLLGAVIQRAGALELSGVLLQGLDQQGNPSGFLWHTSSGQEGRPLGVYGWSPPALRSWPLGNGADGEIAIPLWPGVHVVTLLWQHDLGKFPPGLVLNLYFNGDNLSAGISAVVPYTRGLTQFHENTNSTTLSLYLREVENRGSLYYDDGELRARLGVAFYMPSDSRVETTQWRPADFVDVDRVGVGEFKPDGQPDGELVFELTVGASDQAARRATTKTPSGSAGRDVAPPLTAQVGGDEWMPPPTSSLQGSPDSTPAPKQGGVATTAPGEPEQEEVTPAPTEELKAGATTLMTPQAETEGSRAPASKTLPPETTVTKARITATPLIAATAMRTAAAEAATPKASGSHWWQ